MARQKAERRNKQPPRQHDAEPTKVSGKLIIITIAALALVGGGFSWWYRYTSTHRAAEFWGGDAVKLIRDAPDVYWLTLGPMNDGKDHVHVVGSPFADHYHTVGGTWRVVERRDISQARGLVHLRNELLLDRSFQEETGMLNPVDFWRSALEFRASTTSPPLLIMFTADGRRMLRHAPPKGSGLAVPTSAFADGLKKMSADWVGLPLVGAEGQSAPGDSAR
jgi:hypothetical protein